MGATQDHSALSGTRHKGGVITRVALDECLDRSVTGRAYQFCPRSSNTEQARPKRQVVGESPAGDTILGA